MANWVQCSFVGTRILWVDTACGSAWRPLGGGVDVWLQPLPEEVREIIKEVAEAQAEKPNPPAPSKVPVAPLKLAFRRAEYQYKTNYAEIYREVYERILAEMREDEEEALFLLM